MSRILVIEDEEPQRKALRDILVQKGYSVFESRDGVEGMETALREHPDMIVLDVRMPKMDGMTMMHKLREDHWGKSVPIIILTNYDTNDTQIMQIATDLPSYFLLKSNCTLERISQKIEEVLKK